jgi:hypothetical protein
MIAAATCSRPAAGNKVWELRGSDNRENREDEFSEDRAAKFTGSD